MTITERLRNRISPSTKRFVAKNIAIVERMRALMHARNITPVELAERMGERPAAVDRLLSGMHDLTLHEITRMEKAIGAEIISVAR